MDDDEEQQELQDRIMRYRMMEHDVTDPLARGLLLEIVAELEAAPASTHRLAHPRHARASVVRQPSMTFYFL